VTTKIKVTPEEVRGAELEAARNKGTGSFFLDILGAPLKKRPALSEAVAKYRMGLTKADIAAGHVAGKVPVVGRLFNEEVRTPIKTVGGFEVAKVEKVKRLTAPLVRAQKFLMPIFAYEGLRRVMAGGDGNSEKKGNETMTRDEQAVMLKAASLIDQLGKEREFLIDQLAIAHHEKQASSLAREMVEKGMLASEDMDKKASELFKEPDLGMVKKAVDLAQGGFDLGKIEKKASVDGSDGSELDPMTEYLVNFIHGR
jgi:hypothetical protein